MMTVAEQAGERSGALTGVVAVACELLAPILASTGTTLDRIEHADLGKRARLQVFIDKPGGVSVEDCARVSRQLSAALDEREAAGDPVVRKRFTLEVSSPGLTRPLRSEADFARFAGRLAVLITRREIEGRRRLTGVLRGVEAGHVLLDEAATGKSLSVPLPAVAKAHLEVEDAPAPAGAGADTSGSPAGADAESSGSPAGSGAATSGSPAAEGGATSGSRASGGCKP